MLLLFVKIENVQEYWSLLSILVDENFNQVIMVIELTVFYDVKFFGFDILNNKILIVVFLSRLVDENLFNYVVVKQNIFI